MGFKQLLLISAVASIALGSDIGHVIAANGKWCDGARSDCSGQRPHLMSPLTVVKSDSRIVRVGKMVNSDQLRIRSYATGVEVIFSCEVPLDCQSPLDLRRVGSPEGIDDKSALGAFFRVLRKMSSDQPQVWIAYSNGILTPRGPHETRLEDAVLELKSNMVDLAPLFAALPKNKYVAKVCPVRLDGSLACPHPNSDANFYCGDGVLTIQWDPQARPAIRYDKAEAGLINVSLCNEQGMFTDRNALALIVAPEHFREAASEFEEARHAARALKATEADPTIETTVRIFLHHLAYQ